MNVLPRAESVQLLQRLGASLTDDDSNSVAEAVGDLPLALVQAAGVLSSTGMGISDYLHELTTHTFEVLNDGRPAGYPRPLAAAVRVAVARVGERDPAAVAALQLCSLLSPELVPLEMFLLPPLDIVPSSLARAIKSRYTLRRTLGTLADYGLAKVRREGVQVHRLTQAVVADLLDPAELATLSAVTEAMLVAAAPRDSWGHPAYWPRWALIMPHMFSIDLAAVDNAALRNAVVRALRYLQVRGEPAKYHQLTQNLYEVGPAVSVSRIRKR